MKGITKHIIIALVGFFFMLSACEISTSFCSNTFGDDYDYYVQPDNSQTTTIFVHLFTDISLVSIPEFNGFTLTEAITTVSFKPLYFQYYSPPLHQRNCVWLI